MTKCATGGRRPELPIQGLWDAGAQGGHIWVPKETQRRRGIGQGSVGQSGESSGQWPRRGLASCAHSVLGSWRAEGSDNAQTSHLASSQKSSPGTSAGSGMQRRLPRPSK